MINLKRIIERNVNPPTLLEAQETLYHGDLLWKSFKESTLSPESIAERDRLADEFLSIWVEAFNATTKDELNDYILRGCEVYDKITEIHPGYSLERIDWDSTDYLKPDLYRLWQAPLWAFYRQERRLKELLDAQDKRQKSLAKLRRCRKS